MDVLVEEQRFRLIGSPSVDARSDLARGVRSGLGATPKTLSSRFLYDAEGSRLFEEICTLQEYYPTRTEARILSKCVDELVARFDEEPELVELGSGSAEKTRLLLRAFLARFGHLRFTPIDIAREMVSASSRALIAEFDGLEVHAIVGEYLAGVSELAESDEALGLHAPHLVIWLGSSIGNLSREQAAEFLSSVRGLLELRDRMLIGIDHRKDRATLEAAYDDARGVTARFSKNMLVRINRELGANFDVDRFEHRARYDEEVGRVEIHLVSLDETRVRIEALDMDVSFRSGEGIHTESAYKYSHAEIDELAAASGFTVETRWTDPKDRFSVNLFAPSGEDGSSDGPGGSTNGA